MIPLSDFRLFAFTKHFLYVTFYPNKITYLKSRLKYNLLPINFFADLKNKFYSKKKLI
jgi:hypothetical protein